MPARRFGLSFEMLQPPAAHPNRTDIACFVGCVARRRARAPVQAMPEVLVRWLEDQVTIAPTLPLRTRRVDLTDAASLIRSLGQSLKAGGFADATIVRVTGAVEDAQARDGGALQALIDACRELEPVPVSIVEDLRLRDFRPGGHLTGNVLAAWLRIQQLRDLPVMLDAFDAFDALFAWDERPVLVTPPQGVDPPLVCTSLGAAVRAFFGEGGARCHVVRTADPAAVLATDVARFAVLGPLGLARANETAPADVHDALGFDAPDADPASWRGVQHVLGLAEVSFLCVPDLPDALAFRSDPEPPTQPAAVPQRHFHECVEDPVPPAPPAGRFLGPPRLRDTSLNAWMQLVRRALATLGNRGKPFNRGDVQLVASLPLTVAGATAPTPDEWLAWMSASSGDASPWWSSADEIDHGEALAHLQAGYPWLVTRESADCPGGIEAPEGTLAGVLARNALARGAYRSAAFMPVVRYVDAEPRLNLTRAMDHTVDTPAGLLALAERICLIGPAPRGPQLHSDVTFATQAPSRPGPVRRLVNVVVNAARRTGEEHAFEPNGEPLWAEVRQRLDQLGRELAAAGALSSDVGARAFVVRCGRDTMTQSDVDAGRLVAEIELVPAQPIVRILVVLALRDALPIGARAAA